MSRRLLLIDFDGTLFDSSAFLDAAMAYVTEITGVSREKWLREIDENRKPGTGYDFLAHVARHLPKGRRLDEQALARRLARHSFVYDDVADFLDRMTRVTDLVIVTVGPEEWQRFKIRMARLEGLPAIYLGDNKGEWLAGHLTADGAGWRVPPVNQKVYEEVMLIDDRGLTFRPLHPVPGLKMFHIWRENAKYKEVSPAYVTPIKSLKEVT